MASALAQKSFVGTAAPTRAVRVQRSRAQLQVVASSKKGDPNKAGLNSVENDVVRNNLLGKSRFMGKKDWVDASGRKGKGKGVYQFEDKYGVNVDAYQPIYAPDTWSSTGDTYKIGTKGLIAWAGLVVVLLAVGANLIYSTSQLAQ